MFSDLLITADAKERLSQIAARPPHGLILTGAGSVTLTAANELAAHILQLPLGGLGSYPYYRLLRPEKDATTVGIEQIQSLRPFLALKTTGIGKIRRICIIAQTETMQHEAQNALLKMLEEPPEDTIILLATGELARLLPTIRSRAAVTHLPLPNLAQLQAQLNDRYNAAAIKKAFHLSGGNTELLVELLDATADNPWLQSAEAAKAMLGGTLFDRLVLIDRLSKDVPAAVRLLSVMKQIAHAKLRSGLNVEQATQWHKRLLLLQRSQQALAEHAQTKLTLTHVALQL